MNFARLIIILFFAAFTFQQASASISAFEKLAIELNETEGMADEDTDELKEDKLEKEIIFVNLLTHKFSSQFLVPVYYSNGPISTQVIEVTTPPPDRA